MKASAAAGVPNFPCTYMFSVGEVPVTVPTVCFRITPSNWSGMGKSAELPEAMRFCSGTKMISRVA